MLTSMVNPGSQGRTTDLKPSVNCTEHSCSLPDCVRTWPKSVVRVICFSYCTRRTLGIPLVSSRSDHFTSYRSLALSVVEQKLQELLLSFLPWKLRFLISHTKIGAGAELYKTLDLDVCDGDVDVVQR